MEVRNGRDLAVAFAASNHTTTALLLTDVWLHEADWDGLLGGQNGTEPILLARNFTILGSPSLPAWPLLNLGFVHDKIRMGNGVTLMVQHVVSGDFRSGLITQAPGFDLAAPTSSGGLSGRLVQNDSAVLYSVCFPAPVWSPAVVNATRIASYPGAQSAVFGVPPPNCTNTITAAATSPTPVPSPSPSADLSPDLSPSPDLSSSPSQRRLTSFPPPSHASPSPPSAPMTPSLLVQPPMLERCWADRGVFYDVALYGADMDAYGNTVPNHYHVWLLNVTYLCAHVMSYQCIAEYGPLGCALGLLNSSTEPLPWRLVAASASSGEVATGGDSASGGSATGGSGGAGRAREAAAIAGGIGGAVFLGLIIVSAYIVLRPRTGSSGVKTGKPALPYSADGDLSISKDVATAPGPAGAATDPRDMGLLVAFPSYCCWGGAGAGIFVPSPPLNSNGDPNDGGYGGGRGSDPEPCRRSAPVPAGPPNCPELQEPIPPWHRTQAQPQPPNTAASPVPGRVQRSTASEEWATVMLSLQPQAEGGRRDSASVCDGGGSDDRRRGGGTGLADDASGGGGGKGGERAPGVSCQCVSYKLREPAGEDCGSGSQETEGAAQFAECSSRGFPAQQPPQPTQQPALCMELDEHAVVSPQTPPRPDLTVGEAAAQAVTLLPVVRGKGAYGTVYEGLYGGERVAVKVMRDVCDFAAFNGGGGNGNVLEHVRASFAQEVEVLGRCRHPNVVRLLAACLTPPRLLLVMELMEASLERLLYGRSGEPELLPLATVLHIALGIARGLEYLHPTILHRDLKPGNILVNDPGGERPVAKISDFGISRLRSTVLITKNPEAGTPAYMAPETFDVKNYSLTHHVDIFSFGVCLWACLTGQHPWKGHTMMEVAYKVTINRERLPLAGLPAERCPPRLRALIQQCWEHEPRRRPAAAEVVKVLQALLGEVAPGAACGGDR